MTALSIEIWSDVVCPWCAIGKAHLDEALTAFPHPVEITWRSFELDPSAPPVSPEPLPALLAAKYGGSASQIQQMMDRVTTMAARRGLRFDLAAARPGNTLDAHRLLHLAREHGLQGALKARFLRAYLSEGRAIGDPEILAVLADEVGLPADETRAVLASDRFRDAVRADEDAARDVGIQGVPFFVVGDRYAVSGAQLPEVLLGALERAWGEGPGAASSSGSACGPDGCAL
jgi:predicted DsbA family dithiol-disulfide isomerase